MIEAVRRFCNELDNGLHSSIKDAKTIHIVAFASFLEAALNLKGKRAAYENHLNDIKGFIRLQSARAQITRLSLPAAAVIKEAQKQVSKATLDREGSIKYTVKEAKERFMGRIGSVIVADSISIIEFSSLIVTAKRNGFIGEISEQIFVNPPAATRFVQKQMVRERLSEYAKELAKETEAEKYHVFRLFDHTLHHSPEDLVSFLINKNPFELFWEKVLESLSKPQLFPLLITSDHGYYVFEENGVLWAEHLHIRGQPLLDLSKPSLFVLLTRKGG